MYENILKAIEIGNLKLKNRIVFAPTSWNYSEKESLEKFGNLAKGGVGLIVVGDINVSTPLAKTTMSLKNEDHRNHLKLIIDEVHKYGCAISAQLFHSEYDTLKILESMQKDKLNGVAIRDLIKISTNEYINNLSVSEILKIQNSFVESAKLAKDLGFDMIQIHGDRLLGSFSSNIFNLREDDYGGNVKKRAVMSIEIVEKIRAALPDFPIEYKLPIRKLSPDIGKGGSTLEESSTFVTGLDKAGIDSFHVCIANHSKLEDTIPSFKHPYLLGEGCFLDLATEVRKHTNKIVCTVGKLQTPEFIDEILENKVDMVALSRQLIADTNWVNKVEKNETDAIKYCKFCNVKCTGSLINRTAFGCILDK